MEHKPEWFVGHEAEERKFFASKDDLKGLATKADTKEILEFLKKVDVGIGFFKFSFNNASKIGSFLMLMFGIYILVKYGVVGAASWIVSKAHL